jgi:hypothetical protein
LQPAKEVEKRGRKGGQNKLQISFGKLEKVFTFATPKGSKKRSGNAEEERSGNLVKIRE